MTQAEMFRAPVPEERKRWVRRALERPEPGMRTAFGSPICPPPWPDVRDPMTGRPPSIFPRELATTELRGLISRLTEQDGPEAAVAREFQELANQLGRRCPEEGYGALAARLYLAVSHLCDYAYNHTHTLDGICAHRHVCRVRERLESLFDRAGAGAGTAVAPPEPEMAPQEAPGASIPCPEGLEYLPHQITGAEALLRAGKVLLADEQGVGKTITAIAAVNAMPCPPGRVVIICPAGLKLNWKAEWEKWSVHPAQPEVAYGDHLPGVEAGVIIINYDIVHRHQAELLRRGIDCLICDEAHALKTYTSRRSRAAYPLISAAKRCWCLTGTPLLNRPIELYGILKHLGFDVHYPDYKKRYCEAGVRDVYVAGGHGEKQTVWWEKGAAHLDELAQRLRDSGIYIRRLKKDVLTLPPKRHSTVLIDPRDYGGMDDLLKRAGEAWEKGKRAVMEFLEGGRRALAKMSKEEQMALGDIARLRHEEAREKVPGVRDFVEVLLEDGEQVVCFAHHRDVLQSLHEELGKLVPCSLLLGGMTPKARAEAVAAFQGGRTKVFVGSLLAASEGITLTAGCVAVFAELDWVPGRVWQAEDRVHRIGQDRITKIFTLAVAGGIDSRIAKALESKERIVRSVLVPSSGTVRGV